MRKASQIGEARANRLLGGLLWLLLALALLWPAAVNHSPLIFFRDTVGYLSQGQIAVHAVLGKLASPLQTGGAAQAVDTGFAAAAASASLVRSVPYAVFAYGTSSSPIGAFGPILVQAMLIMGLIFLLVDRAVLTSPAASVAAAAVMVALTSLPWFVAFLMPDILAAALILCALITVRGLERHGPWANLFVFGVACFAMLAHYGHIPLGLALALFVLPLLALQSRLTRAAALIMVVPIVIAIGGNLLTSAVAFKDDEVSIAPKRLPLVLARSIIDGPARWHLEAHCAEYHYAICGEFKTIPDNLGALLWGEESIVARATPRQLDQIRTEEPVILWRAFLEYPVQQSWSLAGNAVTQLWSVGMDDFNWAKLAFDADGVPVAVPAHNAPRTGLDIVALVQKATLLASVLALLVFGWRDGLRAGPRERELLAVTVVGLVANALIFGGLSVPVDRYQARVVWLLPLLAALFWLRRVSVARSLSRTADARSDTRAFTRKIERVR